jgi:hypothetical protein
MKGRPRWNWLSLAAVLATALTGPASADDCAVLLDSTGTLLVISDRGTISQFFCHSLPVFSEAFEKPGPEDDEGAAAVGYGEGFSISGVVGNGDVEILARAEGNSAHPTQGVVRDGDCVVTTVGGRPAVQLTPPGVTPPLYMVPHRTEVHISTSARSASGKLGIKTLFRFVGGGSQVDVTVAIRNTGTEKVRLHGYKRFADVDLTADPANSFEVRRTLECVASDPDIDPATGFGQNGFSREFYMRSKGSRSNPGIMYDGTFSGGAYHNAVGNILAEQTSDVPVFAENCLLAHQPFCSPGATRWPTGFWFEGGETPWDYEDDRALFIKHSFGSGVITLTPSNNYGTRLYFQYEVR